jgi:hypothetical protein
VKRGLHAQGQRPRDDLPGSGVYENRSRRAPSSAGRRRRHAPDHRRHAALHRGAAALHRSHAHQGPRGKGIGRPSTYANIVPSSRSASTWTRGRPPADRSAGRCGRRSSASSRRCSTRRSPARWTGARQGRGGDFKWQAVKDFYGPFKESLDHIDEKKAGLKNDLQEETDVKCDSAAATSSRSGAQRPVPGVPGLPQCKFSRPLTEQSQACTSRATAEVRLAADREERALRPLRRVRELPDASTPRRSRSAACLRRVRRQDRREGHQADEGVLRCSNYKPPVEGSPAGCDWASWDKPTPIECPSCGTVPRAQDVEDQGRLPEVPEVQGRNHGRIACLVHPARAGA